MYRLLFFLLVLSYNLNGQAFQYGFGVQYNFGYLQFDDKVPFEMVLFKPSISGNGSISAFAAIQPSKAFQFQIAGQIGQKRIRLAQNIKGANVSYKGDINHMFFSTDLSISARYLLKGTAKWTYLPSLGFHLGFQELLGYSSSGVTTTGTLEPLINLVLPESQSFTAFSLLVGIGIRPPFTLFKRPFELNCNFLYGPKKFLKRPIDIGVEKNPLIIQGKYHSLSIGLNFYLRRLKKTS